MSQRVLREWSQVSAKPELAVDNAGAEVGHGVTKCPLRLMQGIFCKNDIYTLLPSISPGFANIQ